MALITDPDSLSQGSETVVSDMVFGSPSGAQVTITSAGTNLPAIAAGEYFEIRGHSESENNGLYLEDGGSPTTGSITASKQTGVNPVTASSESASVLGETGASTEKSVHVDLAGKRVWLLQQGNLSTDGVAKQAVYSFLKEEWKSDPLLIQLGFPMDAISTEVYELKNGWAYNADSSRQLLRTGGWRELNPSGDTLREYLGVISLGDFEDAVNDRAYYQFGDDPTDTAAATDFVFSGPVNEAILIFEETVDASTNTLTFADDSPDTITRASGSWITDGYKVGSQVTIRNANTAGNNGTYEISEMTALELTVTAVGGGDAGLAADADTQAIAAYNHRRALTLFLRVRDGDANGKTFAQANLASIGVTDLFDARSAQRFPLSNATDLKISETDANISTNSPYTEVRLRYLPATYNREVDSTTKRDFGVIVDVGTYSQSNGASAGSTTFSSANLNLGAGEALADYAGGSLIIHEGTDQGTHTISGTPTDNAGTLEITLTVALTGTESNLSFTMERATPLTATAEEIYEKIQYQLRQASDIDETGNTVTGRTADALLGFTGDTLEAGATLPNNPNGGGSGVFIEGFDTNDTNRLEFTDNTGTTRTFPFVAAGTINFNDNLVSDTAAEYWMFFAYSTRTNVSDGALSGASGATATLSSAGNELPVLADQDYILISGYTDPNNNGVWRAVGSGTTATVNLVKYDGATVSNESATAIVVDENPIDSPTALIVDNNSGVDIQGFSGSSSIAFDFDYDGNTQGGRTAATDADIVLRAIGLGGAQFVEATGTITRNTGLSFSLVAALERNYSNP